MNLLFVTIFVFVFNLPFGYWRANVPKYKFQWALAIHIPVLIIIILQEFIPILDLSFTLIQY